MNHAYTNVQVWLVCMFLVLASIDIWYDNALVYFEIQHDCESVKLKKARGPQGENMTLIIWGLPKNES